MPSGFCSGQNICVYGQPMGSSIVFTVHSAYSGWASLGIGSQMDGSCMYVGWPNTTQGYTVVSTRGNGHRTPSVVTPQDIQTVPLAVPAPDWAKLSFSFSRSIDGDGRCSVKSDTSYFYAFSNTAPSGDRNSINSRFSEHSRFGFAPSTDFTKNPLKPISSPTNDTASNPSPPNPPNVNGFCMGQNFCVYGQAQDQEITFTLHAAALGWASFGIGKVMDQSCMYLGWKNSTGGYTVASTRGVGHGQPKLAPVQDLEVVPTTIPAPKWAKLAFSFKRKIGGDCPLTSQSDFIYAYADSLPAFPDQLATAYGRHSSFGNAPLTNFMASNRVGGVTTVDESRPRVSLAPSMSLNTILIIHGILCYLAWGLAPIAGIYLARNMKHWGHSWFVWHRAIFFGVTGLGSLVGVLLIILYKSPPHFGSPHGIMGLLTLILMVVQMSLGVLIDKWYDPERLKIPLHDKIHAWMGYSVWLFANVAIVLGLLSYRKYDESVSPLVVIIPLLVLLASTVFIFKGKKKEH